MRRGNGQNRPPGRHRHARALHRADVVHDPHNQTPAQHTRCDNRNECPRIRSCPEKRGATRRRHKETDGLVAGGGNDRRRARGTGLRRRDVPEKRHGDRPYARNQRIGHRHHARGGRHVAARTGLVGRLCRNWLRRWYRCSKAKQKWHSATSSDRTSPTSC